jgi:hypothetical protein
VKERRKTGGIDGDVMYGFMNLYDKQDKLINFVSCDEIEETFAIYYTSMWLLNIVTELVFSLLF